MSGALYYKSATDLIAGFKTQRFTPVDALESVLDRIDACEPILNAMRLVDEKSALKSARASAKRWAKGEPKGLLDGVPVAIKDVTETKGWPTLNGSLAVDPKGPGGKWDVDAVVVERFRAHGAVLIGKTETPEFAWAGVTHSRLHGITRNPWNAAWTPGGSSGGSGAAVASGMVALATGTDSGGSIRGPASLCNIVGLKPTFGLVPVWPTSPVLSLEHCGPLARTVKDVALAMSVMAGFDSRDGTALRSQRRNYLTGLNKGIRGLKVAYARDLEAPDMSAELRKGLKVARTVFRELGATVRVVDTGMGSTAALSDAICDPMAARILKNLGRRRSKVTNPYLIGSAAAAEKMSAGDMMQAEFERRELCARMAALHEKYDLILAPAATTPPVGIDVDPDDVIRFGTPWSHALRPFDLTGQPAISVPCGITKAGGPFGLQIIGACGDDARVMQAAYAYEKANPAGKRHPPI